MKIGEGRQESLTAMRFAWTGIFAACGLLLSLMPGLTFPGAIAHKVVE
jgi:hypothetical protein